MSHVLIIEDDSAVRCVIRDDLQRCGHEVSEATRGQDGLELATAESPEVVLLDLRLPDRAGEDLLTDLLALEIRPEVIVLTGHGSVDIAVRAMKTGAFDFLEKPCRLAELEAIVSKAAEIALLRRENGSLRRLLGSSGNEPYLSPGAVTEKLHKTLQKVAGSDLPVLITGETGAGKEVMARVIHGSSARSKGPLLVADCAALQPTLVESELFGHERGAFTGAHAARPGLVETARGGSLFLDEIGELDTSLQAKFLRLLESGEFRRVGAQKTQVADVRFIAATHRDLRAETQTGAFREDLFFRLNVLSIRVPSLRERRDEIVPLARYFLNRRVGDRANFSPETLELLTKYRWPGNVRELRNVVERMAVLAEGEVFQPSDLPTEIRQAAPPSPAGAETLAEFERQHILAILNACDGNKTRAAESLGISQATLYNKLRRYREE